MYMSKFNPNILFCNKNRISRALEFFTYWGELYMFLEKASIFPREGIAIADISIDQQTRITDYSFTNTIPECSLKSPSGGVLNTLPICCNVAMSIEVVGLAIGSWKWWEWSVQYNSLHRQNVSKQNINRKLHTLKPCYYSGETDQNDHSLYLSTILGHNEARAPFY